MIFFKNYESNAKEELVDENGNQVHAVVISYTFTSTDCPANSEATRTGLTECPCIQGYHRADYEGPGAACTRKHIHDGTMIIILIASLILA